LRLPRSRHRTKRAQMKSTGPVKPQKSNRRLLARLAVVAVAMFGFGYAMIPFYEQICKATGLRDIAIADTVSNTQIDAARTVRIELDANVNKLPWRFRPLTTIVSTHPGEV